jgi:hypothetical protein
MTLRRKTFWFVAGPVAASFFFLYFFASRVWMRQFEQIERRTVTGNLEQRVLKSLKMDFEKLKTTTRDYGYWDDAYAFIEDANPAFIKANMLAATLQRNDLNLMMYVTAGGELAHIKTWTQDGNTSKELERAIISQLLPERRLVWKECLEKPNEGILMLQQGPLLLASNPINTSENNGTNRGCVLFGRLLTSDMLKKLAESNQSNIQLHRCDEPLLPPWIQAAITNGLQNGHIQVEAVDKDAISAFALSLDLFGKPALVWQVNEPRSIYKRGLKSVREFVLLLICIGLVFGGVSWWLLSSGVLKRMAILGTQVDKITKGADRMQRVSLSGADELARLASQINDMLDRLETAQSTLTQFNDRVEHRVDERTQAMVAANATLAMEITDRLQSEEALRQSEDRLLESQRIGKVGSWELDLKSGNLTWSAETFRIFGLSASVIRPDRSLFTAMVHPDDRVRVKNAVDEAILNDKTYSIDHRIVLGNGEERHVHEEAEAIRDAGGAPLRVIGTVQDITERKLLEDQLRQAQKMEGIGQLAGGIAHDFNNILTVIQGHIGLVLANANTPPELTGSLKEAGNAANRAAILTRQLLAFSRRQVLDVKPIRLDELLRNLEGMFQRLLGEHIALNIQAPPGLPLIEADTGMLEQVAVNLAVNARDAMPEGGTLTIGVDVVDIAPSSPLPQPEARYGHFVCLKISDTGCGISEDVQKRMFEPFFTTKEFGKGTGLGLATVYGIVKQHRGWIHVESAMGKGACFSVYFPVCLKTDGDNACEKPPSPVEGGKETILVVEDEDAVRLLVKMCLKRYGYHVLEARTGPEALAVWEKNRGDISLLLTDLIMPGGLMGYDLAERLKRDKSALKVIYSSGYQESVKNDGEPLVEGVNFLPKPYIPSKLASLVRECLARSG